MHGSTRELTGELDYRFKIVFGTIHSVEEKS